MKSRPPQSKKELVLYELMFQFLAPRDQQRLLALQEEIQQCEHVELQMGIVGTPFEYWCTHCQKKYVRMHTLVGRWFRNRAQGAIELLKYLPTLPTAQISGPIHDDSDYTKPENVECRKNLPAFDWESFFKNGFDTPPDKPTD